MGLITKANTFLSGTTIASAQVNENFDDIYNEFNGSITNENISASAAIADTKLAQITTAGKVSGAALTSLASIPGGAGVIPEANIKATVALTDAASIATDASLGTTFTITLTTNGPYTLANPTNSAANMARIWVVRQDATGNRSLSFDSDFRFAQELLVGGFGGSLRISPQASSITYIGALYDDVDSKWDIVALASRIA